MKKLLIICLALTLSCYLSAQVTNNVIEVQKDSLGLTNQNPIHPSRATGAKTVTHGEGNTQINFNDTHPEEITFDVDGSEKMIIQDGGNVGIANTAPSAVLHVAGSTYDGTPNDAGTQICSGLIELSRASYPYIDFNHSAYGDDYDSRIMLRESDWLSVEGSGLGINYTSSLVNMKLAVGGGGYFSGDVGIGVSSPTQKLHVSGNMRLTGALYDYNNDPGTSGQVLQSTATGIDWVNASSIGDNLGNHTCTQNLKLNNYWLSNDGGSEGLNINNDGDVYVGSTASGTWYKMKLTNTTRMYGLFAESTTTSGANIAVKACANGSESGSNNCAVSAETDGDSMYNYGVDVYVHGDGIINRGVSSTTLGADVNYAGLFNANSSSGSPSVNYAIYANAGNATTNWAGYFVGDVYTTTSYSSSDEKFKKNIHSIDGALDKLKKIESVTFNYKCEDFALRNFNDKLNYGFIAQNIKSVFPEMVKEDQEGYLCVNYTAMIPVLAKAINEQQEIIEEQKNSIDELKSEIIKLKNQNDNTIESSQSTGSKLFQNSPNPFSSQTQIKYCIKGDVVKSSIMISDMNGKAHKTYQVDVTENGILTIDASEFQPGLYFYSLITDGKEVETKRMIITE
ncbi:MAG: hypothetical protein UR43_C0010G0016 [candidate division TM6 bacterium GW2011_GWF2_33_332]|nr:MAG: hypothetical protein UR43_C0010G0016 [candidate division TM6 bacterium GW2011_GWF2_33_332]